MPEENFQDVPDKELQHSMNLNLQKLKEEFGFILKYEQDDARTLSGDKTKLF